MFEVLTELTNRKLVTIQELSSELGDKHRRHNSSRGSRSGENTKTTKQRGSKKKKNKTLKHKHLRKKILEK